MNPHLYNGYTLIKMYLKKNTFSIQVVVVHACHPRYLEAEIR
jgi:hypothetical protein